MLFTDWNVIAAVTVAWLLYYLPYLRRHQLALLVAASVGIYAYEAPAVLGLLLLSAVFNAWITWQVKRRPASFASAWAAAGVTANLLLLATFKYSPFIAGLLHADMADKTGAAYVLLALPLPVGISFYTFHGISLLLDTLRGRHSPAERPREHLAHTLLYLCFFPQLVAGPITKANYFYPQIAHKRLADIDWALATEAFVTGYFLKLVVANNLAGQTFMMQYPYFLGLPGNDLAFLLFGYSIQIFADFAGYSLIAIGFAALFGYRLPDNFNFPYIARSFSEFWTRWHISLSSWLKDYLYIPLGGNRKGAARTYLNLLVVMALGGLWHGASLSYVVWGLWHGAALAIERAALGPHARVSQGPVASLARGALVFVVVTLGWLLFKLPEFGHVMAYLRAMVESPWHPGLSNPARTIVLLSLPVVLYHFHGLARERGWSLAAVRQPALGTMVFLIVMNFGPNSPFIYFQF